MLRFQRMRKKRRQMQTRRWKRRTEDKYRKDEEEGDTSRNADGNAERVKEKGTMHERRLKCRKGNNAETTMEMQKGRNKREQMQKGRKKREQCRNDDGNAERVE
jgi:hypothetical protein